VSPTRACQFKTGPVLTTSKSLPQQNYSDASAYSGLVGGSLMFGISFAGL
jgi:hypothetical protein